MKKKLKQVLAYILIFAANFAPWYYGTYQKTLESRLYGFEFVFLFLGAFVYLLLTIIFFIWILDAEDWDDD